MGRKDSNQTNKPISRQNKNHVRYDHVRIQRGGGPHPPENHKNIGFPSITGLDLLKITKLQSQHSMWAIIGHASKTSFQWHFAGTCRPIIARLWWFLEPRSPRKNKTNKKTNLSELGPP